MKDNWKEIVYVLQTDFKVGMLENKFRDDIATCLIILGWRASNGSVRREVSLPIGNNNSIRPDFVLYKDNKELPIEVKRPGNDCNERQEKQLLSYMRQLKSNVGIYIGSDIRFFYDDPNDSSDAICIYKIEFDENDNKGITFCELLSYDSFDKEYFELFCKEQYDKINDQKKLKTRINDFFSDSDFDNNIKNLIADLFVKEGFDKNEIKKALSEIFLDVNFKIKTKPQNSNKDNVIELNNKIESYKYEGSGNMEYSLDGYYYYRYQRRFVLAVIKKYVSDYPDITFEELERRFPEKLSRTQSGDRGGVVRIYDDIKELSKNNKDILKRFLMKEKDRILLNDNTIVVVSSQWGNSGTCTNFRDFLEHINKFYTYYCRDIKTKEEIGFPKKTY